MCIRDSSLIKHSLAFSRLSRLSRLSALSISTLTHPRHAVRTGACGVGVRGPGDGARAAEAAAEPAGAAPDRAPDASGRDAHRRHHRGRQRALHLRPRRHGAPRPPPRRRRDGVAQPGLRGARRVRLLLGLHALQRGPAACGPRRGGGAALGELGGQGRDLQRLLPRHERLPAGRAERRAARAERARGRGGAGGAGDGARGVQGHSAGRARHRDARRRQLGVRVRGGDQRDGAPLQHLRGHGERGEPDGDDGGGVSGGGGVRAPVGGHGAGAEQGDGGRALCARPRAPAEGGHDAD
eukprot:2757370-Rhodomonas_salina.1